MTELPSTHTTRPHPSDLRKINSCSKSHALLHRVQSTGATTCAALAFALVSYELATAFFTGSRIFLGDLPRTELTLVMTDARASSSMTDVGASSSSALRFLPTDGAALTLAGDGLAGEALAADDLAGEALAAGLAGEALAAGLAGEALAAGLTGEALAAALAGEALAAAGSG